MDYKLNDTFVTKFDINKQTYYAKVGYNHNEHDLLIIDIFSQDRSWSGKFTREDAKNLRENVDESEEEYFTNMIIALKRKDDNYILDFAPVNENVDVSKFIWKRKIPKGYLIHGSVMLQRNVPVTSKDTIIDHLMQQNNILLSIVEDFKNKHEVLSNDLTKCKNELENFISEKRTMESTLYGKFVQVLNTKKKKIRLLDSLLENTESNSDCSNVKYLED